MTGGASSVASGVRFYTVTNADHFVGVVGLVNSLRSIGHTEAIFVTDAGLTDEQRAMLEPQATVVDPPPGTRPQMAKTVGPLRHPAEVMVVVDADVLVVRHLGPLLDTARSGKLVFFVDTMLPGRHFPEWAGAESGNGLRVAPYVNAGHYLGDGALMLELLEHVARSEGELDTTKTYFGSADPDNTQPFFFGDQDLMNAYLMTAVDPSQVLRLDNSLAPVPPFAGIRCDDGLRCVGPGTVEPYLLHHILQKPWLGPTRENCYVKILRRQLWDPRAAISLDPQQVPLRLRPSRFRGAAQAVASSRAIGTAISRGELSVGPMLARAWARLKRRVPRPAR